MDNEELSLLTTNASSLHYHDKEQEFESFDPLVSTCDESTITMTTMTPSVVWNGNDNHGGDVNGMSSQPPFPPQPCDEWDKDHSNFNLNPNDVNQVFHGLGCESESVITGLANGNCMSNAEDEECTLDGIIEGSLMAFDSSHAQEFHNNDDGDSDPKASTTNPAHESKQPQKRHSHDESFWFHLCDQYVRHQQENPDRAMSQRAFLKSHHVPHLSGEPKDCRSFSRYLKRYEQGLLNPTSKTRRRRGPRIEPLNSTTGLSSFSLQLKRLNRSNKIGGGGGGGCATTNDNTVEEDRPRPQLLPPRLAMQKQRERQKQQQLEEMERRRRRRRQQKQQQQQQQMERRQLEALRIQNTVMEDQKINTTNGANPTTAVMNDTVDNNDKANASTNSIWHVETF